MTDDRAFEPTIHRNHEAGTVHVQYDWTTPRPISTCIVSVVRTVPELEFADGERLFDAVDPEALDSLFEPVTEGRRRSGVVRIAFRRFSMTVHADGELVFDPAAEIRRAGSANFHGERERE